METNQVLDQEQDVTVDDIADEDLFVDSKAEETPVEDTPVEETASTVAEAEQSETKVPEEESPKPFSLHVKYNGEEKDLNEDEARTFAQKGMNYDRVYEPLRKLAKLNGMEVGEYINKLNEVEFARGVSEQLDALKEKYPEAPEEMLNELAQKRAMENQNLQFQKMEDEVKGNDLALETEAKRQIDVFNKEYPNLKPDELDDSVYEYVKQGYTLTEAYNKWLRIQEEINKPIVEAKQKAEKQNEENKKKSLGNMTNAGSESGEYSDFFSGMDSMI